MVHVICIVYYAHSILFQWVFSGANEHDARESADTNLVNEKYQQLLFIPSEKNIWNGSCWNLHLMKMMKKKKNWMVLSLCLSLFLLCLCYWANKNARIFRILKNFNCNSNANRWMREEKKSRWILLGLSFYITLIVNGVPFVFSLCKWITNICFTHSKCVRGQCKMARDVFIRRLVSFFFLFTCALSYRKTEIVLKYRSIAR